jgi:hypothetical protein
MRNSRLSRRSAIIRSAQPANRRSVVGGSETNEQCVTLIDASF